MKRIKKYVFIALVSLGLFFFVGSFVKSCNLEKRNNVLEQQANMAEVSNDSLRKEYNSALKSWEYSRDAYVAENAVLKADLGKYSARLDSLKKAKPKADVGLIVDMETKTDTVVLLDTMYVDSANRPIYQYTLKDTFTEGTAIAYPDSLKLKLMTRTGLVGSIEDGRISVTPTNKNVTITGLEGFQVKTPKVKTKFWKGLGIGIGVGVLATGAIILAK